MTTALVAGIATHLPGLFYLIALQAIVAEGRSLVVGAMEVLLFNVIWFGATIASVVIFLLRPGVARRRWPASTAGHDVTPARLPCSSSPWPAPTW